MDTVGKGTEFILGGWLLCRYMKTVLLFFWLCCCFPRRMVTSPGGWPAPSSPPLPFFAVVVSVGPCNPVLVCVRGCSCSFLCRGDTPSATSILLLSLLRRRQPKKKKKDSTSTLNRYDTPYVGSIFFFFFLSSPTQ